MRSRAEFSRALANGRGQVLQERLGGAIYDGVDGIDA